MTAMPFKYGDGFYQDQREGSRRSARLIIPRVLQLLNNGRPSSVGSIVDVGCGVGTWLGVAGELGIKDVVGVDGAYVNPELLEFPRDQFVTHDLLQPLQLKRTFDLVISLEVAEHLPVGSAGAFVRTLTDLGPVVLFSAAIPFQNGTFHLNEQFQDYWADLFRQHGYIPVDCVRKHFWTDSNVEPWYTQNALVYVRESLLPSYPGLASERVHTVDAFLSVVHPWTYQKARMEAQYELTMSSHTDHIPLKRIFADLPRRVFRAITRRNHPTS